MRVLNDENQEPKHSAEFPGFITLFAYIVYCGLGIMSVLLAPLPLLVAHLKLKEPWPKIIAVAGTVLAMLYFELPVQLVGGIFIFALFVADGVALQKSFWLLLGQALVLALVMGVGGLVLAAQLEGFGPVEFWIKTAGAFVDSIQKVLVEAPADQIEGLRSLLTYQAPFLLVTAGILSLWLSVGAAIHFGWISEDHAFSAKSVCKQIALPVPVSIVFLGVMGLVYYRQFEYSNLVAGIFRVLSSLMFVQGCCRLSELFAFRKVPMGLRTLIYSVGLSVGFYVVMGVGVISPWLRKRKYWPRQPVLASFF